ncbi:hypothetical protein KJ743_03420, partial [Patescibacteria group bacterium]|nr:hypothetical protein [Patescibacteria group bacterium]
MIHNLNNFVNESLGSSLNFSAHGGWGKEKNLAEKSVRPKVLGAKPKQAGKKEEIRYEKKSSDFVNNLFNQTTGKRYSV